MNLERPKVARMAKLYRLIHRRGHMERMWEMNPHWQRELAKNTPSFGRTMQRFNRSAANFAARKRIALVHQRRAKTIRKCW